MVYCAAMSRARRKAKTNIASSARPQSAQKRKSGAAGTRALGVAVAKLSEAEQDLVSHMQNGYELLTDSLGGNPVLRSLKDGEVVRPTSANRNTIKALDEHGVIAQRKGSDPLTLVWRLKKS